MRSCPVGRAMIGQRRRCPRRACARTRRPGRAAGRATAHAMMKHRDVVEHDRGDHLVGTGERLQAARDEPVERARHERPPATASGTATTGGPSASATPTDGGRERAHQELALGADVEQAGLEAEAHRQARRGSAAWRVTSVSIDRRSTEPMEPSMQGRVGRRTAGQRSSSPSISGLDRIMITAPTTSASRMAIAPAAASTCPARPPDAARSRRLGRVAGRRGSVRRRAASRAAGRHQQADLLLVGGRPIDDGHEPAAVHHADAVGELQDLVQLGGHEQHRGARVALGDRLAVDELDAADVQAARRLVEHQQPQVAVELARHDDLLLVAAGERARVRRRPRACGCRSARSALGAPRGSRRRRADQPRA